MNANNLYRKIAGAGPASKRPGSHDFRAANVSSRSVGHDLDPVIAIDHFEIRQPTFAPHPHAGVLFYDFALSEEGQTIIAEREFVPTSSKIDTPLNKVPMTFVDARVAIDEYDKWKNLYTDLFGAGR